MVQTDLGQHHLQDERAIMRIVEAAALQPGERVLDAGAGTGALTRPVAEAVGPEGRVYAVEIDSAALAALQADMPPQVQVLERDLLELPFPKPLDAVVANPPFKIAAPFLERVVAAGVGRSVLVLPRELIERLVSPPGSGRYGKLTVRVALRAEVQDLGMLSRYAFDPAPTVACGFVLMRARRDVVVVDAAVLDEVLDAALTRWDRKATQTTDMLARKHRLDSAGLTGVLKASGWADLRASALPPEAFTAIARHLDAHTE